MCLIEVRVDPGFGDGPLSALKAVVARAKVDVTWRVAVSDGARLAEPIAHWFASLERSFSKRPAQVPPVRNLDGRPENSNALAETPKVIVTFQAEDHPAAKTATRCPQVLVTWPGRHESTTVGLNAVRDRAVTTEVLIRVFDGEHQLLSTQLIRVPTQFTFAWTHDLVLNKVAAVAGLCVNRLLDGETWPRVDNNNAPPAHLARERHAPLALLDYTSRMAFRFADKMAHKLSRRKQTWQLRLSAGNWRDHLADQGRVIDNPPGRFWADPFLWHQDGRDVLFVEDYRFDTNLAHLSALEIDEQGRVHDLGICLQEDFHLSYPFPFEWQGQLYMCPETHSARQIRVYRCEQFPLKWRLHAVLMNDVSAADTVLFERDGRWWMLTNIDSAGGNEHCTELHAFWADSPLSTHWTPHQGNPLCTDASQARNGGLIRQGRDLYRVNQLQGYGIYGAGFQVNRIERLSPDDFHETQVARYVPPADSPELGAHHLSSNGRWTVSDHLQYASLRR